MTRYLFSIFVLYCFSSPALSNEMLTLDTCLQLARNNNPLLQEAASGPRLAEIVIKESKSVYRPQVELNAGYTEQQAAQQVVIGDSSSRITSYNVCYTKLLRGRVRSDATGA